MYVYWLWYIFQLQNNIGRKSDAQQNSKFTKLVSNNFQTDDEGRYGLIKAGVITDLKYSDCHSLLVCLLTLIYISITK